MSRLGELKTVQKMIQAWYQKEGEKINLQSKTDEIELSETVRLYHHDIHKKNVKRSSILQRDTYQGMLQGHESCSKYLGSQVEQLLLKPHPVDNVSRDRLLQEVEGEFTDVDNEALIAPLTSEEVKPMVMSSNLRAAPGTDGIPSLLYVTCWGFLGVL